MSTSESNFTKAADYDAESAVRARYAEGARQVVEALCCPTDYDPRYLEAIPQEILDSCPRPSRERAPVPEGDTLHDLGWGAGTICDIRAQKVGPEGRVIGVDFHEQMLELARRHRPTVAERIGYDIVSFRKGRIQDLALDLEAAERWLRERPVDSVEALSAFEAECARIRREAPLVAEGEVDAVVSNCVLNLVRDEQKRSLFEEIHRVLRRGGRAVISDIVCDETPTARIRQDPDLWSGCIAGAFQEEQFLRMFEDAGFYGVEILSRAAEPWQVIDGVEFRSMTVRAYKGKEGPCLERSQAVIYKGPWKQVHDDDGHVLRRGERMAVCDKTFRNCTDPHGPYAGQFEAVPPRVEVPLSEAGAFDCRNGANRHPRETKGEDHKETRDASESCDSGGCC
jgi:SAM-dependent methyltransferase